MVFLWIITIGFIVFYVIYSIHKATLEVQEFQKDTMVEIEFSEEDERIRREKIKNEQINQKENEKIQKENDYRNWVESVKKNNEIYLDKEYIHINGIGFLWFENKKYYLYIYNTGTDYYEWGYYGGLIVADKIGIKMVLPSSRTEEKNNKLAGAAIGAMLGGVSGAIIGQNVTNGTKQVFYGSTHYYLEIDKHRIDITEEDYFFFKAYIETNDNKKDI